MRGDGRLYREPGSRFWWMAYYVHGRYVRQSTEETDEQKARRVLRKHIAAVLHGDVVANERRVTLGDLLQGLETDYTIQGRRSAGTIQYPLQHLRDYFAPGTRAMAISTDRLEQYIAHRLAEAAAASPSFRSTSSRTPARSVA